MQQVPSFDDVIGTANFHKGWKLLKRELIFTH